MSARNVPAGVDHDHERRADRQGSECARPRFDDREPDRADQEERADELDEISRHGELL